MALESLYGAVCIVTLVEVWWGEFNSAAIARYSGVEFTLCVIVEDVPIDMNYLGVFPVLVDGLVGFDEVVGLA